ncbi:MAG: LSm family protein [Thermoproteota archaeon]|jgi:small nuclear ribonucleoprotein|nr:LSm family protein [Thermoproteota archaeon]
MSASQEFLQSVMKQPVLIKLKGGREIRGILKSFDVHMNLILQDSEEIGKDGNTKKLGTLIIRGDNVIMISPIG